MTDTGCAYCGKPATTRDHIPPKKLFPQPWTDDLITVPACSTCNNGSSSDDEYFIWMVTISAKAYGQEADKSRQQRTSMPTSKRRRRMASHIVRSFRPVEVFTQAGIFLGQGTGYEVDGAKINRVLERVVRGLYFVERRIPVPTRFAVYTVAEPRVPAVDQGTILKLLERGNRSIAKGAFEYWFSPTEDRPASAIVLMRFFGGVIALGFIMETPVSEAGQAEQSAAADRPRDRR